MWTLASDSDRDFINDLWETNAAPGFLLGFEICYFFSVPGFAAVPGFAGFVPGFVLQALL